MINLVKMQRLIKEFLSNGNRKKAIYKYEYSETKHCPVRVPNGFMDLHDFIQQSADDIDFKAIGQMLVDTRENVVDHFKVNGETFDMTGLPRDIHEYELMHNKLQNRFEELPDDMKALFGNDFNNFKRSWNDGSFTSIMKTYFKPADPAPVEQPKEGGAE